MPNSIGLYYRRLLRQYENCREAYTLGDQPALGVFSQDRENAERVLDLFSCFFITVYHMKDWITKDTSILKQTRTLVGSLCDQEVKWLIARDIANGQKHLELDHRATHQDTSMNYQANLMGPIGSFPIGGVYNFTIRVRAGGGAIDQDILGLASECIDFWKTIFREHMIPTGV